MARLERNPLDELLREALDCAGPEQHALLLRVDGQDPALGQRLRRMLAAANNESAEWLASLDASRHELFEALEGGAEDLSGSRIGPWRLQQPIARGGLATVYLARREDGQFTQKVAFKVLRRGLDTDDVVTRFRAERQILATMKHPAIARILDGGALPDGRPYLVLEFVEGEAITLYCRRHEVDIEGRVQMLVRVLEALQHAHQYLVVHRDIKPNNVLVSDGGRVSLLDFGIAKLLNPTLVASDAPHTRAGLSLLTPAYASPEQFDQSPITTASDIYQVGALLFELLGGQPPPRASERDVHEPALLPSRYVPERSLARKVRGDLDAIVARAMNLNPALRYASADQMAADLRAWLAGRPVSARPDTLVYRCYKLARRRPLLLPMLAVTATTVLFYVVTLNVHNQQIRVEQERAVAAEAFMVDLLGSANPYVPADPERGRNITVVEALDIGVQRLRSGGYSHDERLRASLLESIARVYENVDQHHKAIDVRLEALPLQRDLHGEVSETVIHSLRALGDQYRTIGDYDIAGWYYQQQLETALALFRPADPRLGVAEAASAHYLLRRGEEERSEQLYLAALAKLEPAREEFASEWINTVVNLARVRGERDLPDSSARLQQVIQFADARYGPKAPLSALARLQYGVTLSLAGQAGEAEEHIRFAIHHYEEQLGRDHGATLIALSELGQHLVRRGDLKRAEGLQRETLGHYLEKYGTEHRGVAELSYALADNLVQQGRPAEAIPLYGQSHAAFIAVLGPDHPLTQSPLEAQQRLQALAAKVQP
ncbi:MAG TPA: serine/threonine-protein kinase [Xanthomonadales bacterium]|nr:serine/threonine-protein kinase [Xanthomonadales bacterium]